MSPIQRIESWLRKPASPEHLRRGELGERAARKHLQGRGMKFLTANYRSPRGEIDLVFRDEDCLQYVSFAIDIWSGLE